MKHLVGDGGLSMRVVPRICMIIRPGILKMYSGTFLCATKQNRKALEAYTVLARRLYADTKSPGRKQKRRPEFEKSH